MRLHAAFCTRPRCAKRLARTAHELMANARTLPPLCHRTAIVACDVPIAFIDHATPAGTRATPGATVES
jgi:hypothetical protein